MPVLSGESAHFFVLPCAFCARIASPPSGLSLKQKTSARPGRSKPRQLADNDAARVSHAPATESRAMQSTLSVAISSMSCSLN